MPGNGFFSPTSPWNAPLPADAPLHPWSTGRIAALNRDIAAAIGRNTPPIVNVSTYSTPVYVVPAGVPLVPVKLDSANGSGLRRAWSQGVPIPPEASAAQGSDGHLTIYQPSTDSLWEFWRASKMSDGWHAQWGGAMKGVSANPGHYSPSVWPDASLREGWNWGSSASSIPVAAGLITAADVQAGHISHTLAAAIPEACASLFASPAQRTDGRSKDANCIPEGARLRLDPTLNVDALPISPIARLLARAAQEYGIIVRDTTGSAFAFFGEAPASAGAAVFSEAGPFGAVGSYRALAGFPWDRLQVVASTECRAAPCGA